MTPVYFFTEIIEVSCSIQLNYPGNFAPPEGLEPTTHGLLTTLCYHSQIITVSWRETQHLTNISGAPLVYRPNSASWIICCGLDCLSTILKSLQVIFK